MPKMYRKSARSRSASRPVESLESRVMLAVFTVTNVDDSGAGSLRDALTRSNNTAGVDTIAFNIASSSKVIRPASPLPDLWDPAVLDATTQPGYAGKPLVQLDGANAGANASGVKLWGGSTVKGLSVTNFAVTGVDLFDRGFGGNVVQGMWVGVDLAGNAAGNAGQGVGIWKSANNLVGGPTAADRNVISGAKAKGTLGVLIQGVAATNNVIQNNFIGTDPTGTLARPNAGTGVGVQDAPNNRILGNVISGNVEDGILIFKALSTGTVVQGNRVGIDASGTKALPNGFYGIEIQTAGNAIGGATAGERNVFSGNAKAGIVLWTAAATNNVIRGNYVGTDAAGTAKVGNVEQGIAVSNSGGNAIRENLISGNKLEAVGIFPGSNNSVTGNTLGFGATGAPLPNGTWAVTMVGGSNGNTVTGNTIAAHPSGAFLNSGTNTTTPNSSAPPVPADVVAPKVTSARFVYDAAPNRLVYTFSEDVSASLTAGDLTVTDEGTGAKFVATGLNYDRASNTANFSLATALPRGTYTAQLTSAGISDAAGNKLDGNGDGLAGGDYAYRFSHLPGDANRDGAVDFADLLTLSKNYGGTSKTWATGDFTGDGMVAFDDLLILSKNYNTTAATPVAAATVLASPAPAMSQPASTSTVFVKTANRRPTVFSDTAV